MLFRDNKIKKLFTVIESKILKLLKIVYKKELLKLITLRPSPV